MRNISKTAAFCLLPVLLLFILGVICNCFAGVSDYFGSTPISSSKLGIEASFATKDGCFCKLQGKLDDCTCSVDTVDYFNNNKIYPLLQSLLVTDYFRYFKVNLYRECPFWPTDSRCALKDCSVTVCPEDKIPAGLKGGYRMDHIHPNHKAASKYLKNAQENDHCDENHGGLGAVNISISNESYEDFVRWQQHDDSLDNFCEMDDEMSAGMQYVDLLLNPERFTGYSGPSAHRIWKSIYEENCFKPRGGYGPYTTSKNLNDMCLEKRVFYRAISGLHTSINIHLCAEYFTPGQFGIGHWGLNVKEFERRFDPKLTEGEGPERLKNLYFLYLLELRALAKAAPYLEQETFYTGNSSQDKGVKLAIKKLLDIARSFPNHFNESVMFKGNSKAANKLKKEFKQHFRNISRIMDCVGCEKCRLWGKLQTQGLGTAFKILFSGDKHMELNSPYSVKAKFHLTRTEIVALLNAFGKLSNSVFQVDIFRKLLKAS